MCDFYIAVILKQKSVGAHIPLRNMPTDTHFLRLDAVIRKKLSSIGILMLTMVTRLVLVPFQTF